MTQFSDHDAARWQQAAAEWNQSVIAAIKKVNEADAEWFSVLDVVPSPRLEIDCASESHQKVYREHDLRLKRLGEMVQNLWRE